ncbi:hypothetical protein NKH18_15180 [Streptomyces sp. M10(2022)]
MTSANADPAAASTRVPRPSRHPGHPAGQGGDGSQEPSGGGRSPGRRTKVLAAAVGVVAVSLIALPFLAHDKGSTDVQTQDAAAARPTTSPSPKSSLVTVPDGLESASATPSKKADEAKSAGLAPPLPNQNAVVPRCDSPQLESYEQCPAEECGHHRRQGHGIRRQKAATPPQATLVVYPIARLNPSTSWKADRLQLGMQADGNLVLYDRQEKRVLWAAGVSGKGNIAYFQDDGNLVVYNVEGHPLWASNPAHFTNATLNIRPDGNVVIMSGGKQVWATNTHV